jgi:hypothetical protein
VSSNQIPNNFREGYGEIPLRGATSRRQQAEEAIRAALARGATVDEAGAHVPKTLDYMTIDEADYFAGTLKRAQGAREPFEDKRKSRVAKYGSRWQNLGSWWDFLTEAEEKEVDKVDLAKKNAAKANEALANAEAETTAASRRAIEALDRLGAARLAAQEAER